MVVGEAGAQGGRRRTGAFELVGGHGFDFVFLCKCNGMISFYLLDLIYWILIYCLCIIFHFDICD